MYNIYLYYFNFSHLRTQFFLFTPFLLIVASDQYNTEFRISRYISAIYLYHTMLIYFLRTKFKYCLIAYYIVSYIQIRLLSFPCSIIIIIIIFIGIFIFKRSGSGKNVHCKYKYSTIHHCYHYYYKYYIISFI